MEHRIQSKLRMGSTQTGVWLVAMGAASWAIVPHFRLDVLKSITTKQFVWIEHLILALYAIPGLWMHRQELRRCTWKHILLLLFISWGGSVLAPIMFNEVFARGNNPNGVMLLQKLQPLFGLILARFMLKEKLPRRFSLLLLMALAGTYLLTFGWEFPFSHYNEVIGRSSLFALGSALLWGCSTAMGRLLLHTMKYETVTSLRFLLAVPLLTVLITIEAPSWSNFTAEWGFFTFHIFLQAMFALAGMLLYYRGLSSTKAAYATLAELSFPLVGLLMNWIMLHQVATGAQITGFVLIWVALYIISKQS